MISIGGMIISAIGVSRVNSGLMTTQDSIYDTVGIFAVGPQLLTTASAILSDSTSGMS